MSETPILKQAQDKLRPFEHRLLDTFSKAFQRKRPPTSLRALQPLAMVFLLEAFGLAFLLDKKTVRLAVLAARGPGKGDDDDLLDDSDEMAAIRWASARQDAVDRAYLAMAKERYKDTLSGQKSLAAWIKAGYGPDRTQFEKQWGERNPIDPATAPKCFDPSAQLSILDAVGHGDGYLGAFVSTSFLTSSTPKQITCMGQTLDLEACETLDMAAWRAVSKGWIAYLDHRGIVMGLRLIPRTDGVQTRLRAPLVNIVSMHQEDKRDEQIVQLEANIQWHKDAQKELDQRWQDATGASDPEMARELTAQRIEQIEKNEAIIREGGEILSAAHVPPGLFVDRIEIAAKAYSPQKTDTLGSFVGRELVGGEYETITTHEDGSTTIVFDDSPKHGDVPSKLEVADGVGRMIWPDPNNAPTPIACANAIVAHRRGEFVELEFPATPKIFENIRAWLMFHSFGLRAPTPDATGYCTCAIGSGGEIPPEWNTMKQGKRDSYPGFALFGPGNTGKVVFCANEPTIKKTTKRSIKKAAQ
jgi:hypothetical protein